MIDLQYILQSFLNELFTNRRITGMGKIKFVKGEPFILHDKGYIGYRFTFRFGDMSANVEP